MILISTKWALSFLPFLLCTCTKCQLQIDTCHWHFPYMSTKTESCAAAAADFHHSMRGVQGEEQKWGTLCSGRNCQNSSTKTFFFQEPILWVQFLVQKNTKILHGVDCSLWPAESFCKKLCSWLHVFPLHQNHIYTDLLTCHFGAVSKSYLWCCLPGCSPHFAPDKT